MPIGGEDAAVSVQPGGHEGGADEEGRAATPAVDVDLGGDWVSGHGDYSDCVFVCLGEDC